MEYLWMFLIGGAMCLIGQILMDTTRLTAPRILVIFVVSGAILTGLGLYQPIVDFAKTGATVPLPGFGYNLVKGAMESVNVNGFMGALLGGVENTAAGVAAAIAFGYIISLIFSPKSIR